MNYSQHLHPPKNCFENANVTENLIPANIFISPNDFFSIFATRNPHDGAEAGAEEEVP